MEGLEGKGDVEGAGRGTGRLSELERSAGGIARREGKGAGTAAISGSLEEGTTTLDELARSEAGMTNRAAAAVPPSGSKDNAAQAAG